MAARPRLVFINRYYWPDESATSQMLTDLSVALAGEGFAVTVLASRQRLDRPRAELPPEATHEGVQIRRLWSTRFGRDRLLLRALDLVTFLLAVAAWSLAGLRRGDVVIAKSDPPLLGLAVLPAVRLRRAHLVNWLQDIYPEIASRLGVIAMGGALERLVAALRDHTVRAAGATVVPGRRMAEFLRGRNPDSRVEVIPNWAAGIKPQPPAGPEHPLRKRLGLGSRCVFGYSGTLGRAHCFDGLLEAGRRLADRDDIAFLIIGGGAKFEQVRKNAPPNWHFLPYQPREAVGEVLGAADVHLVSLDPRLEGLVVPCKVYGILSVGRLVVNLGSSSGEVAEILRANGAGVTVDAGDGDTIAQVLQQLVASRREPGGMQSPEEPARPATSGLDGAIQSWRLLLDAN